MLSGRRIVSVASHAVGVAEFIACRCKIWKPPFIPVPSRMTITGPPMEPVNATMSLLGIDRPDSIANGAGTLRPHKHHGSFRYDDPARISLCKSSDRHTWAGESRTAHRVVPAPKRADCTRELSDDRRRTLTALASPATSNRALHHSLRRLSSKHRVV